MLLCFCWELFWIASVRLVVLDKPNEVGLPFVAYLLDVLSEFKAVQRQHNGLGYWGRRFPQRPISGLVGVRVPESREDFLGSTAGGTD